MLPVLVALAFVGCKKTPSTESGDSPPPSPGADAAPDPGNCRLVEDGFGPAGELDLSVEVVAEGLRVPWGIAFLPGGELLVTERGGAIRLVREGRLVPRAVAEVDVSSRAEGGLLGLALDPEHAENRGFYIYFTAEGEGGPVNRVERWILAEDGAAARREATIVDEIPAAPFHDGGFLTFGPEKMLYIGTGDAGDPEAAQDRRSLAGKILRVNRDGEAAPGNPWPGHRAYVMGIRNTQGFGWLESGAMVIADHGPSGELGRSGHDEVSVVAAEQVAGANLGWPTIYGCERRAGLITPVISWKDAVPPGGALVVSGDGISTWRGDVLLGTLRSEHLQRVALSAGGRLEGHEVYLRGARGRIRTVAQGPDGAIYLLTSNCDGRGTCPDSGDQILRVSAR